MTPALDIPKTVAWYCVRSHVKREHIAAKHLRLHPDLEVYVPRIRYRKSTRRGAVWFEEAMFPGYLFVRFDLNDLGRTVLYTTGVTGMVRFSGRAAVLDDSVILALQASMKGVEVKVFEETLKPGERTVILEGPFQGLEVVVQQVLPASDRIRVLFEFLGQMTVLDIEHRLLEKVRTHPLKPQ